MAAELPEDTVIPDDIIPILGTSDCSWCGSALNVGDGITLKTCLHPFCTDCLTSLIRSSKHEQIMCPVRDHQNEVNNNQCEGYLTRKEIEHILGPERFRERLELLEVEAVFGEGENGNAGNEDEYIDLTTDNDRATTFVPPEIKRPRTVDDGYGDGGHAPAVQETAEQVQCISLAGFPTSCSFCTEHLPAAAGIILQTCGCIFCKDCLVDAVVNSVASRVMCPRQAEAKCGGYLLDREIKSLVSEGRYEEYMGRSLREAKQAIGNLFNCPTPGCQGCCEVNPDASNGRPQIFNCTLCSKLNCVQCRACHEGISCSRFKEVVAQAARHTGKTSGPEFDAFLEEHMKSSGWDQLSSFVTASSSSSAAAAMAQLEAYKLIPSTKPFTCQICTEVIQPRTGTGVVLRDCLHTFCKECLVNVITHSEEIQIECPFRDPEDNSSCNSHLSPREIQALVTTPVLDQHLQRSIVQAELVTPNSFHCCTPNCTGWCVLEPEDYADDSRTFHCPVCDKRSCIHCKAIHSGLTCEYYQQSINDDLNKRIQKQNEAAGAAALQKEIQEKRVMPCPRCQYPSQKISGCNHVVCGACKLSYNWEGV